MEPPTKLKKLALNYKLESKLNDRKFYRKYNLRLEAHFNSESFKLVSLLKDQAKEKLDKVRRERWVINYYTNSYTTLASVITQVLDAGGTPWGISWFPEHLADSALIRQKPTDWEWGIKLSSGVSKEKLLNFIDNHCGISMDQLTTDAICAGKRHTLQNRTGRYSNSIPNTRGHTYFRFSDLDLKNLFIFTFAEYVLHENTFIHKDKVNTQ